MENKLPDDELLYYAGTDDMTKRAQSRFVQYFNNAPGTVLEVGCGKGVMLEMLKRNGIQAYGIDISNTAVKLCLEKGLDAIHCDVLSYLKKLDDCSLGGIFCAHVIEHLQPPEALEFLNQIARVLKPKSKLILITPNAKDLRTAERFWMDITHVRLYPGKLLHELVRREGFKSIQILSDREPAKNILERTAKTIVRFWFLGYMFTGDLIIAAER